MKEKKNDPKKIAICGLGWIGLPLAKSLTDLNNNHYKLYLLTSKNPSNLDFNLKNITFIDHQHTTEYFDTVIVTWPQSATNLIEGLTLKANKIIFLSSTAVYKFKLENITENAELDLNLAQSQFDLLCQKKINSTILRLGGLIGYNRNPAKFLAGKKNLKGKNHPTNLIHRDDVIHILKTMIEKEKLPPIMNAVSDHHPLKKDFYQNASKLFNCATPLFDEEDNSTRGFIDNTLLKETLNYHFIFKSPNDYLKVMS